MSNRDRPLRQAFGTIPNALWTLPDLTANQRCLLGWLHSHADDYLSRLTLNRIGKEYGCGTRAGELIRTLQSHGWLELLEADAGHPVRVVLLSEPWEQLMDRSRNVNTTVHETEHPRSRSVNTNRSQIVNTEKNTLRTTDVEHHASSLPNCSDRFNEFWDQYPRRVAKKDAAKAWAQMTPTDRAHALVAIPHHVALWRAEGRGTRTVPYPATWLRRESWEDELQHIPERTATQGSVMDRIRAANQTVRSTP